MNRSDLYRRRRAERRAAFDETLRVIGKNQTLFGAQVTDNLRRRALANFGREEITDAVHQALGPEALRSALFGNTPGRRR